MHDVNIKRYEAFSAGHPNAPRKCNLDTYNESLSDLSSAVTLTLFTFLFYKKVFLLSLSCIACVRVKEFWIGPIDLI